MINIECKCKTELSNQEYDELLTLRYRVFKQRLNWDVDAEDQHESDNYDHLNPTYLLARNEQQMIGCWRILPTRGNYMLKDTFPQCLGGEKAPESESIYELSRFAVERNQSSGAHYTPGTVTMEMFKAIYLYGVQHSISHYVTVTSTGVEKLLKRIGLPHQRFGSSEVHTLGDTKSVGLLIPVDQAFRQSVGLA
ncbi:acyl-homoserine-lactone synthase [Vibrio sp. HA2012]|uniref:acyl-homoserine-lactone synthase n=1 Tax=Vibrio sp. HA2012 TaxID=1971595 RepID=UPI000C2BF365|nr:acyl-homoserine-lactone synthase [Vibrio sp. HA2012]PJC86617.1 acyl-homoserine-lactone synthase [Vibrio sp. HA2012]